MSLNIKLVFGITLVALVTMSQSSEAQRFRVQQQSCTCQSQTQYYGAQQNPVYNQYSTNQYQTRQYATPQVRRYYAPQPQYATPQYSQTQYAVPQYATPMNQTVNQQGQYYPAQGSVVTYPNAPTPSVIQQAPTLAPPVTQSLGIVPAVGTIANDAASSVPVTGTNTSSVIPAAVPSPTLAPVPTGETAITPHAEPPVADEPVIKQPTEVQPESEKSILSDK